MIVPLRASPKRAAGASAQTIAARNVDAALPRLPASQREARTQAFGYRPHGHLRTTVFVAQNRVFSSESESAGFVVRAPKMAAS